MMNPLPVIARSLYWALDRDLLPFTGKDYRGKEFSTRPHEHQVEVTAFVQTWGNTACGFPGISGQAFTPAYTVIVEGPQRDAAVYFGGRLAYHIDHPNQKFVEDMGGRRMVQATSGKKCYETQEEMKP